MTTECQANCEYKVPIATQTNMTDQKCNCKQCLNFKSCKVWAPSCVFDCNAGRA